MPSFDVSPLHRLVLLVGCRDPSGVDEDGHSASVIPQALGGGSLNRRRETNDSTVVSGYANFSPTLTIPPACLNPGLLDCAHVQVRYEEHLDTNTVYSVDVHPTRPHLFIAAAVRDLVGLLSLSSALLTTLCSCSGHGRATALCGCLICDASSRPPRPASNHT